MTEQVAVATNFLYRDFKHLESGYQRDIDDTDGIRGDLGIETIGKALGMHVRVVAADGGSSSDFLLALEKFRDRGLNIIITEVAGRASQRRRAFEVAATLPGVKAIVYTQPEKASLLDYLPKITGPVLDDTADVVIPSRNPELFRQFYPDYMRESELRVNATYDWIMRRAGCMIRDQSFDWFFGPVVFKNDPEIIALFLKRYRVDGSIRSRVGAIPNPEMHSDGHYFPIIEALFRRKRVVSVEIPFLYPSTQKANEMSPGKIEAFRQRRRIDGAAYRLEAIHFLEYLKGNLNSKFREVPVEK